MKILFFGDVVGKSGRQALAQALPKLQNRYSPDAVIVNGENTTHGKGINKNGYNFFVKLGVDCITGGDHSFDIPESEELLSGAGSILIRPANFPNRPDVPGRGWKILSTKAGKLGVISLQGRIFMDEGLDNPFDIADKLLEQKELKAVPVLVDFHTEATSEIVAMGQYLDGRVSAVLGTHTHVQTNDAKILPKGAAYISDVGMVGSLDSVIGVNSQVIIKRFLTGLPVKHTPGDLPGVVNAVFLELKNKRAIKIEPISQIIS